MIVAGVVGAGLYIVMEILPASTAVMWPMLVVMTVALMMIYVFRALYYATVDEEGTYTNLEMYMNSLVQKIVEEQNKGGVQ